MTASTPIAGGASASLFYAGLSLFAAVRGRGREARAAGRLPGLMGAVATRAAAGMPITETAAELGISIADADRLAGEALACGFRPTA